MNLQLLQQKLPEIRRWIDRTLAAHSANALTVASYCFSRLSRFYGSDMLSTSRVVEVPRVPVPPLGAMGLPQFAEFEQGDYAGITYRDTYFVRSGDAQRESLHFHELVHVVQWRHLGPDRFLMAYAIGYFAGGGYRNNPLEIMAYDLQVRFDQDSSSFDSDAIIRHQLDNVVPVLFARASKGEL